MGIKNYLTDDDIVKIFEDTKHINNLNFSTVLLDVINDENQFLFLNYFLKKYGYEEIIDKVKTIDETDTKYYNHIMDVLNCKSSDILVSILDKTNLTINKKQEILLLKTRKSCNI